MVLEWTTEEASLLQDTPDIFQHQSAGYLRTSGQATLYETCVCVIHTIINLQLHVHYYEVLHNRPFSATSKESLRDSDIFLLGTGTGDFMRSECMKHVLVSFTLVYTHSQLHVH